MSLTREITIWCDDDRCGRWRQASGLSARAFRRELAVAGWVFVGGVDLCHEHRPADHPRPLPQRLPRGVTLRSVTEIRNEQPMRVDGRRR